MFEWIMQNLPTIIICSVIAAVVALIIIHMVKDKKRGKSSCGCGCSACAMKDCCHGGKH